MNSMRFFQTIFHSVLALLALSSVNSLLYDPFSYITIPYFDFTIPNHSLNLFLMIVFFYIVYYSLSHLSFWKRVIFSATLSMYANIFYDMLWNFFYLGANDLPFNNLLNLISLAGITTGASFLLLKLNKDFSLFTVTKRRITQTVTSLFVVVCFLTGLFVTNFFREYFYFITVGAPDPHNLMWAVSRVASFAMWLPILRWGHG